MQNMNWFMIAARNQGHTQVVRKIKDQLPPSQIMEWKTQRTVRIHSHGSNTTRNSGEFLRYVYLLVIQFPETLEFLMFSISGKLRTLTFFDISHSFMYFTFHLWLRSFLLFHVLFSFMYSGLLSVPGTSLFHSLAYKYLYSVARSSELRLLFSIPLISLVLSFLSSTHYSFPDLEIPESGIPMLPHTRKSGIPEGFYREQGNTLSPPQ